ncbi:MFS transporter, partial [Tabrizicola sp.]|uniref:MFS transporter n=1 Tax=Tabrizicola sp. TaxID=2005166 RepID=UPI003F3A7902
LNVVGAVCAFLLIGASDDRPPMRGGPALAAWKRHLSVPGLRAAFGIGFVILFIFVGVFTYVNLHLVNGLGLSPMSLGLVYLVFAPAIVTTPLAGSVVRARGPRATLILSLAVALCGLLLVVSQSLWVVLAGLAIVGASTFFAQASATGYISSTVKNDRAQATGLYLTSYYLGGLVGALVLGQVNAHFGWSVTCLCIGVAMVSAMLLARALDG